MRLYEQQFIGAEAFAHAPGSTAIGRVQEVVRAYEKDLNDLLKQARRRTRTQMIEDLRTRVGSFDAKIASTVGAGDPTLRRVTPVLQTSSQASAALSICTRNPGLESRPA